MSLPKLLYVGHSFHQQTGSSRFFLDLLQQHFAVEIIWDDSWKPGGTALTADRLNSRAADLILFW